MAVTEEKDTDFISQEDIDSLLSQAEEEEREAQDSAAEAMLAETEATEEESSPAAEPEAELEAEPEAESKTEPEAESETEPEASATEEDTDALGDDAELDGEDDEISDRVILEDIPDEPDDTEELEDEPDSESKWGIKKLLLVASPVVLIVLGVLGVVIYSTIRKPASEGQRTIQTFSITQQEPGNQSGAVKVLNEGLNLDSPAASMAAHFIELKKFLVSAPLKRKDLAYVTADVSIELTSSSAARLVKDHAPFYRNIIYDVLKQALTVRDKSKINEISLKIAILKALNSALPERSIKDVTVSTFLMY